MWSLDAIYEMSDTPDTANAKCSCNGVEYDFSKIQPTDGNYFCTFVRGFFDYAVWYVLGFFLIPDVGLLFSAICVAHFALVLRVLSDKTGPMEVSPLMYR